MKALLIDNQSLFRLRIETLLSSRMGFGHTFHASTEDQALHLQMANPDLDIAILGSNLNKYLGLDLLMQLKNNNPTLPIAMVSNKEDPETIYKAMASGASGFLFRHTKPDGLVHAIHHILDGGIYLPETASDDDSEYQNNLEDFRRLQHQLTDIMIPFGRSNNKDTQHNKIEFNSAVGKLLTKLYQEHSQLTALAFQDELTGLANRRSFNERLGQALVDARLNCSQLALVYIDLDHFKEINDNFGHQAGDKVLEQVAKRLQQVVRESDTVARIGGDEFTIILNNISEIGDLRGFIDRLHQNLRRPLIIEGKIEWQPRASIGVAIGDGSESAHSFINKADRTLYKVKNDGRDNFAFETMLGA